MLLLEVPEAYSWSLPPAQSKTSGGSAGFQNKSAVQYCNRPYFSILHELKTELNQDHNSSFSISFWKRRKETKIKKLPKISQTKTKPNKPPPKNQQKPNKKTTPKQTPKKPFPSVLVHFPPPTLLFLPFHSPAILLFACNIYFFFYQWNYQDGKEKQKTLPMYLLKTNHKLCKLQTPTLPVKAISVHGSFTARHENSASSYFYNLGIDKGEYRLWL